MTDQQDRIARKIRKMLAIAEDDAASTEEVQNAMNMAQRLMDDHHLSESDLAHEPEDDFRKVDKAEFGDGRAYVGKRLYTWESTLASFVSKFVGCKAAIDNELRQVRNRQGFAVMEKGRAVEGKSILFYGVAEDVAIAVELYDELRQLIASLAVLKWGSVYKNNGAAYAEGFVTGLDSQLKKAKEQAKLGGGYALILTGRRDELIEYKKRKATQWLSREQGIRVTKSSRRSGTRSGSDAARQEGHSDGQNSDVQATRRRKIGAC